MNKIKLSQVIEAVYNEVREIFIDPEIWVDNTEEGSC